MLKNTDVIRVYACPESMSTALQVARWIGGTKYGVLWNIRWDEIERRPWLWHHFLERIERKLEVFESRVLKASK